MSTATTPAPARAGGPTTGTVPLLRASVRHDGRGFLPWILIATALAASSMIYPYVFNTEQERQGFAAAIGANPAIGLIFGPGYSLTTTDGFAAWRSLALGGFLAAMGAIFTLTKATRAQEDSGQAELLASGVMGRSARLASAVALCLVAEVLLGLVAWLVTIAFGGGVANTALLAATLTATGWMFTGVAAITAQIGAEARTANSMAVGVLGVLFLARGVVYSLDAPSWTIWINPLGWMTETEPAYQNTWWPLLLAVALTGVLLTVAFWLQARREFGAGAIPPKPGPDRGTDRSTWKLAVRINKSPILTWTVAFAAIGAVFGYMATSVTDILGSNPTVQEFLASGATTHSDLVSAFLVTILSLAGILAAIPGVQTLVKVRSEEMADRVEPIMATATSRPRYYASNTALALLAPTLYLLLAGTLVAALASTADIGVSFGDALLQAVATIPATWTVVAVSVLVVGARPIVTLAAWIGVLASFGLTLLGPTFDLPDWALGISPYWHIPNVTDADPDWTGLGWITLVTLLFLAIGFAGFRRRDLAV